MLRELVGGMISRSGGEVELVDRLALDFVAPPDVREQLGLSEFGRLNFGLEPIEGAERISFESDWIERLERLAANRGRAAQAVVKIDLPPLSDPARVIQHGLKLQNSVYRLADRFQGWTRYLMLAFRYTAVSDEKRTGLIQLLLNLGTGSAPDDFVPSVRQALYESGDTRPDVAAGVRSLLPPPWTADRLAKALKGALPIRIRRDLSQFITGMQRRLDRDQARLVDYYEGLRQESIRRSRKKGGDPDRERLRVDSILREYHAKVSDLSQKYALVIDVNLLQAIEVAMPVWRFSLVIKRRKAERRIFLDWNPVARKLEPLPCEYSFSAAPARMVCDDASHIVSPAGLAPCRGCGKEFCRVCHPKSCPKCHHPFEPDFSGDC